MNQLPLKSYNLHTTLLGGQAFVWELGEDGYYYGVTRHRAIKLKHENDILYWQTYPIQDDEEFIKDYLRLDFGYDEMLHNITKDKYIEKSIDKFPNIRLLHQNFEETLISYLFSATNRIVSIRTSMGLFRKRFGKRMEVDGKEIYLFPKIEAITIASLEDLLGCKIGFRAKNVKAAAQRLLKEKLGARVSGMRFDEIKAELIKFDGIGNKVADCIMVYSLKADHITPLDIWGQRVLTQYYGLNEKMKYIEMSSWYSNYFGKYTAWAGQFLFEYIRSSR